MKTIAKSDQLLSGVLLITNKIEKVSSGGRELLCKLNHDVLQDIYGENFRLFELPIRRLSGLRAFINAFRGYIDGLNAETLQSILTFIQKEQIGKVFVDGSNLGSAITLIKHHFPMVEVTTFFHNVEARFFWGSFATTKTFRAFGILVANYFAERKAVHVSDKIICLSSRDSCLLKRIYGRAATHISSMALEDKCPVYFHESTDSLPEKFALFVGGTFYANQEGIFWFVREVVPRIDIPIYIVGRGFDALRNQLEMPGKVVVVGAVDSLADWYRRAQFVIAPIFDGSGMKTKVAEALMYGKKIVGTPEAFSGYEDIAEQAGWVCKTADEFAEAIGQVQHEITLAFDQNLRTIYEKNYSYMAAKDRLSVILE